MCRISQIMLEQSRILWWCQSKGVCRVKRAWGICRGQGSRISYSTSVTIVRLGQLSPPPRANPEAHRKRVARPRGGRTAEGLREVNWAFRSSSSTRHMPLTNASRSRLPVPSGSHSFHISRSLPRSSLEHFQTATTTRPLSLSSGPTSSSTASGAPFSCGFVIKSTDSPLQPAACRVFLPIGGDSALLRVSAAALRCARILFLKTVS